MATNDSSEIMPMTASLSDDVAVYDEGSETFTRIEGGAGNYVWYEEYQDDKLSTVSSTKDITVDPTQINLTQETHSQFIPFEMDRYYDGIDLSRMMLQIHYVNPTGNEGLAVPCNVQYSDTKLRFAWLVDKYATNNAGDLRFEIIATGTNERGEEYVWKTKPNGKLSVLASLAGNGGAISPDDTWYTQFIGLVNEKVSEAQGYANEAKSVVDTVKGYSDSAKSSADKAQGVIDNAKTELSGSIDSKITEELKNYYTSAQVDQKIADIDYSSLLAEINGKIDAIDGLAKFDVTYNGDTNTLSFYNGKTVIKSIVLNRDPSAEWVTAYDAKVDKKIEDAVNPIKESVGNLPETLKSDYYNKEATDALLKEKASAADVTELTSTVNIVKQTADSNKSSLGTIGNKVAALEETVNGIDKTGGKTYDATYNEEKIYTLWEIENEGEDNETRTAKSQFKIEGGGSGGGTSSILKIEYVTTSPMVVTVNDKVIIKFNFSGTDSSGDAVGEGTSTWKVGKNTVATGVVVAGENTFDATEYINIGTQKLTLTITDDAGSLVTKSWTVQKVDIRLESTFNDKLTYNLAPVSFDYTPYGAISKDIHFVLDGKELEKVTTTSSGIPMAYTLPVQSHGSHLLESYITSVINNSTIESNHIKKDIIWYDPNSNVPVIGCIQTTFTAKQYDTTNIEYTVFDPKTESPVVTLSVDDKVISTLTLDGNTQTWQYKSSDIGNHVLKIACGETTKILNATIEKLDVDIEPVTANLALDFNPVGYSNNDENRLWTSEDGTVRMTVSDNFDWTNGGYQIDENGDQYFGVRAGSTATFSYNLFGDDARKNGKEFKLIFKTSSVAKSNATFLTCQSGNPAIGLQMNVHEAYVRSSADSLYIPYSEEDIIEFEFNIGKDSEIPMVLSYEDGTPGRPMIYSSDHTFTQNEPVPIVIGSEECDVRIYRMKAYNSSLTSSAILKNFIADARTATEMIARYKRNQIYDENNLLTPESAAAKCPDMRIIKLDTPHFTTSKKDFIKNSSLECVYTNGDPVLDNWKFINGYSAGQGTTSDAYGDAGRNLDFIGCFDGKHKVNSKIPLDPTYITELILGDGSRVTDGTGKISFTRNSVPTSWINFKLNIASSEMVNNAYLQARYNTYLPYKTPANRRDPRIKNDMEFVNCIVFIRENDPDLSTHKEFQDTEWHFYGLGNMGDSKKTDLSRAYDPDDMNEFCVEVSDNTLPNSIFQTGVTNPDGKMKYPITKEEWKAGNTAYDALYNDWDGSFEFRYDCCGDSKDGSATSTDEVKAQIRLANKQKFRDFYEFVITSTDDEFKEHLGDWFIVDSATYLYLFTLRYTMIDNRAKNLFYHWAKHYITAEEAVTLGEKAKYYTIDDAKTLINKGYRFDFWNYDNDTGLGINNSGELTMTYGKEDTDYRTEGDPNSGYVFNAAESVFFCRVRDLMGEELHKMYNTCESSGCWSATSLINMFDEKQNEWPEEFWRLDYVRKYERPYLNGNTRFLVEMMNGKKKYQRRQFERDQEIYMNTKYYSASASANTIMFRCNTPKTAVVKPDYTLHLTPFQDMYLDVVFGNSPVPAQVRAKAGQEYVINCPYDTMDDTAVLIYGASRIQSIGDVSKSYIHDNDFSKATKLKEMIIGNATEGYSNVFLTTLTLGNNELLQKLDIRNTPKLAQTLNLTQSPNLKELYATGSGLTGVLFANGGKIKVAQLPDGMTSVNMKNLHYLTDLSIAGYDNITTMVVENCDVIDVKELIGKCPKVNRVRITGVDWNLENTDLLERIYQMSGLDKNGYNADQSVLAGKVHVPVMREIKLAEYKKAWPDLTITYDSMINQFTATFVNDDENETVLDIQYVDKGSRPVDPVTRKVNPIDKPTKASTIMEDFIYSGWDQNFVPLFSNVKIKATYKSSLRKYTVTYMSKGTVMQESTGEYGSYVFYEKEDPVYVGEESAYKYYLFDHWDKSGLVTGNKVINAVFDSCEYVDGYFEGKDISTLRPVEIYALTRVNKESQYVEVKDMISFDMGADYAFDDVESKVFISKETEFDGMTYRDTEIPILAEDRDFVIAIDYKFNNSNENNATLVQCYKSDGSDGFKLWYNNTTKITWGTASTYAAGMSQRDILVLRHVKGEKVLRVYSGNLPSSTVAYNALESNKNVAINSTLVFGASKADDGVFENYATGKIYWCKMWYTDLGDSACKQLAAWPHESVKLAMTGFKKFYLSDNSGKRSSMTFFAEYLLGTKMPMSATGSNTGGWGQTNLCDFLNGRFYNAIPTQWKQLIKQVKIPSSAGGQSKEVVTSNCYVTIPSAIEVDSAYSSEPYSYEGATIPYITSNSTRLRKVSEEDAKGTEYWLRSPDSNYDSYYLYVDATGSVTSWTSTMDNKGVAIMISI